MISLEKIITLKGRRFLIEVETSPHPSDYRKYEKLRNEIWADPEDTMAGNRNLANENYFDKGGALYVAAYAQTKTERKEKSEQAFAGFSFGFVGVKDKSVGFGDPRNLVFYSQYTAAKPAFQGYGLGTAIKEFQRDVLLDVFKVRIATCTFDPLTGINAYRNVHRLGMDILEYKESFYENFAGLLNRKDVPADRFFVRWDLEKRRQKLRFDLENLLAAGHSALQAEKVGVRGKSGLIEIERAGPVNLGISQETVLVEIPLDFYKILQETDVQDVSVRDIPLRWRMASRQVFQEYLGRGYRVIDFQTLKTAGKIRDFYILQSS